MGPITRRAFLIFSLLTFPSLTLSQEKVSAEGLKLARDYILVFQERAKLKAENTFLDGEAQRLQRATASSTIAKKHIILDQKSRQALLRGLVEDGEQVSDVPANLSALLIQKQEASNHKWRQLRAHL